MDSREREVIGEAKHQLGYKSTWYLVYYGVLAQKDWIIIVKIYGPK